MSRWRRKSTAEADPKAYVHADGTFFGAAIPDEVRLGVPHLHDLDERAFAKILKGAVRHLCEPTDEQLSDAGAARKLFTSASESEVVVAAFSAVAETLRRATRNHVQASTVATDLKRINVPEAAAVAIADALKQHRVTMQQCTHDDRLRYPHLTDLDWRCDVTIATSAQARVLRPTVLMQMTLSDGTIRTFEVPVAEFHRLRYNVARVLKEMHTVERHPIMRLAFDFEQQDLDKLVAHSDT